MEDRGWNFFSFSTSTRNLLLEDNQLGDWRRGFGQIMKEFGDAAVAFMEVLSALYS